MLCGSSLKQIAAPRQFSCRLNINRNAKRSASALPLALHTHCGPILERPASTPLNTTIISEPTPAAEAGVDNYSQPLGEASPTIITVNRLLVAQAMSLLMRLDQDLEEARAQFNQDWFRRIMRARPKAVSRLRRRWSKIKPPPRIALGSFRRRYHANLAKYLYGS